MPPIQVDHAGDSRLTIVFDDTVVSFSLAADVTFGEIARTLDELSDQCHRNPIAIDVTLGVPRAVRLAASGVGHAAFRE